MTTLSQIQTFVEVAKTGSFSKASLRLSVPRSTVSARIRALEERLNLRLLHRTTRRVSLTDEGQRYFERCHEAIAILAEAEFQFSRPSELSGKIRITAPVDISKRHLAGILSEFTDKHPLVEFEVIITDEMVDMIANNIDLALRGRAPGTAGLVARRLGEGRMALYASPRYVAEKLQGKVIRDLSGHVVFDPIGQGKNILDSSINKTLIETRNFELAKALALLSRGIALLPEAICREEVHNEELTALEFNKELPSLALYIVMPTQKYLPVRVRALIDFFVSANKQSSVL